MYRWGKCEQTNHKLLHCASFTVLELTWKQTKDMPALTNGLKVVTYLCVHKIIQNSLAGDEK